ncbi:MAG: hypothetical protein C4321_10365, partial [Chloroflexota bacterium]
MGDYARQAPKDLLLISKESRHPTELTTLYGARFVTCIETEEGKRLAEALIKLLTGEDPVAARYMFRDFFEFYFGGKIFIATNYKPYIRGTNEAIWRRIPLVPFEVSIPRKEWDLELKTKLYRERNGILRWLLEGFQLWRQEGLVPPAAVIQATEEYRSSMDVVGSFIQDCCVVGFGCEAKASQLYQAYKKWCEDAGELALSQRGFSLKLME